MECTNERGGHGIVADRRHDAPRVLEAMTGLLAGLFTALLSTTIVSTALPTIVGDLKGTQTQYAWVVTVALLANAASTPIWGKLSSSCSKLLVQLLVDHLRGRFVAPWSGPQHGTVARRARRAGPGHGRSDRAGRRDHRLDRPAAQAAAGTRVTWVR